jgi:hypothetical protein
MQTLGIASNAPPPQSRWKATFNPEIRNAYDADHISQQGFWIAFWVSVLSAVLSLFTNPVGLIDSIFFFLGANGIRERSKTAAVAIFLIYLAGTFLVFSIIRIFVLVLLVANIRGTWMSAKWQEQYAEMPPRLKQTFWDKLCNQMPPVVWPLGRWVFYAMLALEALLIFIALGIRFVR